MKHYLVTLWGGVDITIESEHASYDEVVDAAVEYRRENGKEHGVFCLIVKEDGTPVLESFTSSQVDDKID